PPVNAGARVHASTAARRQDHRSAHQPIGTLGAGCVSCRAGLGGRVKTAIAAIMAAAVGIFAANMRGTAVPGAPTATAVRTVSVQGVAAVPIGQAANAATATAVYRAGMAAAVADGQSKAEFLAGKVGATIGSAQSIVEDGGDIACSGGAESSYVEYEGE